MFITRRINNQNITKWRVKLKNYIPKRHYILGIETSCDDTGCAVLDLDGNILGESLHSQHLIHLKHGGIIPPIAQNLHRENIERCVDEAMRQSNLSFKDLDAISVTVEPGKLKVLEEKVDFYLIYVGLPMSLIIGNKYGKHLCRIHKKPFIPIHHMKAHALTARMFDKSIGYPFLVLLVSGGHCLLTVAKNAEDFILLGEAIDNAPGEIMDKVARRLKLRNLPEYASLSGGQAIELATSQADNPLEFKYPVPLLKYKNCNFSFAGLSNTFLRLITAQEKLHNVEPDEVVPSVNNLCAGFLLTATRHLCHRLQRAMEFIAMKNLIPPENKVLVMSGGVACNNFISRGIQVVCDELGYKFVRPPAKLCTDNGIMIAWNGVERWRTKTGVYNDFERIDVKKSSPIGESVIDEVTNANLSCKWVKLTSLVNSFNDRTNK